MRKVSFDTMNVSDDIPYGYCHCGCGERTSITQRNCKTMGWVKGEPKKYVQGHVHRPRSPEYAVDDNGCWVWQWKTTNGYGRIRRDGFSLAHRWYYWRRHGECPDTLDHLCRNRACVNPDHLEPCGRGENARRGRVAKLNWDSVRAMRSDAANGARTAQLAEKYGVSKNTVREAVSGRSWKE